MSGKQRAEERSADPENGGKKYAANVCRKGNTPQSKIVTMSALPSVKKEDG